MRWKAKKSHIVGRIVMEISSECHIQQFTNIEINTVQKKSEHLAPSHRSETKSHNVSIMFSMYSKLDMGNTWINNMRESH